MTEMRLRTKEEWLELAERYFDAGTSDSEECELRRFAASDLAAGDKDFDELRAVMGFIATGKEVHRKSTKSNGFRIVRNIAATVAAVAIALSGWFIYDNAKNQCVAYIGGVKYTDTDVVLAEMHRSMQEIDGQSPADNVGDQLSDIFGTINEQKQ